MLPGKKRPSLSCDPPKLEVRDFEPGGGELGFPGDGGAKSNVASSPPTAAGVPQDEQNRPSPGSSLPQLVHVDMRFPATVYRVRPKTRGGGRALCFFPGILSAFAHSLARILDPKIFCAQTTLEVV